ncbi:MAG: pyridoxal phosphate-dependent aminotransferase [Candidatus Omnitrophica bacterium]|nr:pyridoxal phosphate-dependent aminotransferase [Candidatus Omnitrophota bacterium]MDD3988044.1 pyridoxal phosphate-dependent aminotransferase [Candidatus Omnitrophota bacterium]MDD4981629.1 pyridoxal phosphate-dependent aminotransferase [Candidatus Omnitrophota bacterium]MDD5665223.1 pyridoxal phosphate-dependent aminotransferase [Candidatus Omnitrophota bacterium]
MLIDNRLADRLKKVKPSSTLVITSKAKKLKSEGFDIVNLAAGEPDFDTPDFVKDAGIEAIKSGFTKYTPTTGILELRKLITEKLKKDNSLQYEPNQIVVSCGAKHSIFNALFVLANPGDEVLIPQPYWVSYPEMVHLCCASPRFIKALPENNFKVTPGQIKEQLSSKTKILILNSPSNPTGCVYSEEELREIADICVENKIFVISDEIYEKLIYDGIKHVSIASFNKEIYDLTVTINGLSKSYSMTGWRIGYLAAAGDIAEAVSRFQDHSTSNPNSIAQKAAVAALSRGGDFFGNIVKEFKGRRDYCIDRLSRMPKLKAIKPQGAFYIFCDISKTGLKSVEFANTLLEKSYVSLIPGEGFGMDNYVRISFATGLEQLKKGMDRIGEFLNG